MVEALDRHPRAAAGSVVGGEPELWHGDAEGLFQIGSVTKVFTSLLLATYVVRPGLFVDLGIGHYDEDIAIAKVDRDAVDLNVHWFPQSHLELVLMGGLRQIGLGSGGDSSGYALLQVHYRL